MSRLNREFFTRDVLEVAPELLGCKIIVKGPIGLQSYLITEVEAYRGEEDLACHASKGKTPRTCAMYMEGGHLYVYFIYGMYWMLNIVTSQANNPQAVLIRGLMGCKGPGRVGRLIGIDKSFYAEDLISSEKIWLEAEKQVKADEIIQTSRIGIDYAGPVWKEKPWRYLLQSGID